MIFHLPPLLLRDKHVYLPCIFTYIMDSSFDRIIAHVSEEMKAFETFFTESLHCESPLLKEIIAYILTQKGKRIRPLLVFLSAAASGKTINHATYISAAAIEMLHTATIVHDDVVDGADERRGQKSIKAVWRSKAAVLVGDYLLARALLLITRAKLYDLLDIMVNPICEMSEGELIQIEKSIKLDTSKEVYFDIIRKKTAVLISSAMATGAKSVGADTQFVDKMSEVGECIGIAFQIRDDIFDYQKNNLIGKPTGNDIVEKKITLPLLHALQKANEQEQKQVLKWVSEAGKERRNIDLVRNFVTKYDGLAHAESIAKEYSEKAIGILSGITDSPAKNALQELARYAIVRKK